MTGRTAGDSVNDVEDEELTLEERLANAEKRADRLDRDLKGLMFFVLGLVIAGIVTVVVSMLLPDPAPTNHDVTEADLLSKGVHCYDSGAERAAARQRALAAIDRMKWLRDHRVEAGSDDGSLLSPPTAAPSPPIPSITDTPPTSGTEQQQWDATRCFAVEYLPF